MNILSFYPLERNDSTQYYFPQFKPRIDFLSISFPFMPETAINCQLGSYNIRKDTIDYYDQAALIACGIQWDTSFPRIYKSVEAVQEADGASGIVHRYWVKETDRFYPYYHTYKSLSRGHILPGYVNMQTISHIDRSSYDDVSAIVCNSLLSSYEQCIEAVPNSVVENKIEENYLLSDILETICLNDKTDCYAYNFTSKRELSSLVESSFRSIFDYDLRYRMEKPGILLKNISEASLTTVDPSPCLIIESLLKPLDNKSDHITRLSRDQIDKLSFQKYLKSKLQSFNNEQRKPLSLEEPWPYFCNLSLEQYCQLGHRISSIPITDLRVKYILLNRSILKASLIYAEDLDSHSLATNIFQTFNSTFKEKIDSVMISLYSIFVTNESMNVTSYYQSHEVPLESLAIGIELTKTANDEVLIEYFSEDEKIIGRIYIDLSTIPFHTKGIVAY